MSTDGASFSHSSSVHREDDVTTEGGVVMGEHLGHSHLRKAACVFSKEVLHSSPTLPRAILIVDFGQKDQMRYSMAEG